MSTNIEEARNTDLRSKVTAIQAKTAVDNQQALDFAHFVLVAQTEIKDRHGTP